MTYGYLSGKRAWETDRLMKPKELQTVKLKGEGDTALGGQRVSFSMTAGAARSGVFYKAPLKAVTRST